jgi:hypothetical protein
MKRLRFTRLRQRLVLTLALGLLVTPAAYAHGGGVSHHYASPPLDAGSDTPNPDYLPPVSPGSQVRPDNQANRPMVYGPQAAVEIAASTTGNGFDWADAAIGAAGTFGLVVVATGSAFVLRSHRRSPASA